MNTAFGVERVVRDAFTRAAARPRRRLTLVHKTNVLVHAGAVWSRIVAEVAPEFPDVTVDYLHVDAAMIFLSTDPARFDVIVTDNLFGDIVTDLAAGRDRRHRAGREGQHQPRPHRAVDVRAGPRLAPRHRRASSRPTRPPPSSPRACCSTTSATPRRRPGSRRPWWPISPNEYPARPGVRPTSGTRWRMVPGVVHQMWEVTRRPRVVRWLLPRSGSRDRRQRSGSPLMVV